MFEFHEGVFSFRNGTIVTHLSEPTRYELLA